MLDEEARCLANPAARREAGKRLAVRMWARQRKESLRDVTLNGGILGYQIPEQKITGRRNKEFNAIFLCIILMMSSDGVCLSSPCSNRHASLVIDFDMVQIA